MTNCNNTENIDSNEDEDSSSSKLENVPIEIDMTVSIPMK